MGHVNETHAEVVTPLRKRTRHDKPILKRIICFGRNKVIRIGSEKVHSGRRVTDLIT